MHNTSKNYIVIVFFM